MNSLPLLEWAIWKILAIWHVLVCWRVQICQHGQLNCLVVEDRRGPTAPCKWRLESDGQISLVGHLKRDLYRIVAANARRILMKHWHLAIKRSGWLAIKVNITSNYLATLQSLAGTKSKLIDYWYWNRNTNNMVHGLHKRTTFLIHNSTEE